MKPFRLLCVLGAGILVAQPAPDAAAVARKALDQLLAGQYQDLFQTFSPEVQKAIPEATLPKVGVQIKTWGAVERIGDPTVRPGPNKVAVIQVKFATQTIDFQFAINTSGQVAGLFMRPAGQIPWQRPAYSKPDAFHAREVTVGDDEWKLPGTLTLPNGGGPFPGIARWYRVAQCAARRIRHRPLVSLGRCRRAADVSRQ